MNVLPKLDMGEITRLTREGKLKEAMALLRGEPVQGNDGTGKTKPAQPGTKRAFFGLTSDPKGLWSPPDQAATKATASMQGLVGRAASLLGKVQPRGKAADSLPQNARFEACRFTGDAGSRDYKLYIPGGYPGQKLPLVVMLHGCTQDPDDFAAGTRMNELAEAQGFMVAYPHQSASANMQRCWNWFTSENQQRSSGEAAIIAGITRQVIAERNADPARVYAAGLSAGGAMAAILAETYPDLYAAVGVHSGLACGAATGLGNAMTAMSGKGKIRSSARSAIVPTIIFHGDKDHTVNPVNGEQVALQAAGGKVLVKLESQGETNGVAYNRIVERDASDKEIVEYWVLHKAGHAWSGGSAAGSYTDPKGPDASREMVRFFLSQRNQAAAI